MWANLVTESADYPSERAELVDARRGFTLDRLRTALAVMWDLIWVKIIRPIRERKISK